MPKFLDTYYSVFRVDDDGTLVLDDGHDYVDPASAHQAAQQKDDSRDYTVIELKVQREAEIQVVTQVQRALPMNDEARKAAAEKSKPTAVTRKRDDKSKTDL